MTERPAGVRPVEVSVIAILLLILGIIWLFLSLYTQDVNYILFSGLFCFAAYGLWKLKNWGRWVFFVAVIFYIFLFIFIDVLFDPYSVIKRIVGILIDITIYLTCIYYLMKPEIKAYFT